MIVLLSKQVCPFGSFCEYSNSYLDGQCRGLDSNRENVFVCELWAENYEQRWVKDARNNQKLPSNPGC